MAAGELRASFANLAGIGKAVASVLEPDVGQPKEIRPIQNFDPNEVGRYFAAFAKEIRVLRTELPELYAAFSADVSQPEVQMVGSVADRYSRLQLLALARDIEQIFAIRSLSEQATLAVAPQETRVFISHGRAQDWREIQAYIERDAKIPTLELEQQPDEGRTAQHKLFDEANKCSFAVVVMTEEDMDAAGITRARENLIHEIGYFQGRYGTNGICLLHEEGTSIPSNIAGVVYAPFTRGNIGATLVALRRELDRFYGPRSK